MMNNIFLVSLERREAVIYTGKTHHASIRAAVGRFSPDAIAIRWGGGVDAYDVLKMRSAGAMQVSRTEQDYMIHALCMQAAA